jgi:uncharacterized protein YjbI with pentapeptide repeats
MVSRIRIGPEGGPFVEIDEDNGTLDLDAPSGDVDLQSNTIINALFGDIDLAGSQLQNAALFGASLANALDANTQNINNVNDLQVNSDLQVSTINGDNIVTVLDGANETGDYQVQKDGSDTTGVINFKTS